MTSEGSGSVQDWHSHIKFPGDSDVPETSRGNGHVSVLPSSDRDVALKTAGPKPSKPPHFEADKQQGSSKERRRVRSANAAEGTVHSSANVYSPTYAQNGTGWGRLPMHGSMRVNSQAFNRLSVAGPSRSGPSSGHTPSFTNSPRPSEDTGQDDPSILADVQRALQYKSRVEEQLRAAAASPEIPSLSLPSSPSHSAAVQNSFLAKLPLIHSDSGLTDRTIHGDVDFSPSVGKMTMHPVPTSADDGSTLDWSGISSEDERRERRWTMSMSRRSPKNKDSPISRKGVIEKQESLYFDKLLRVKSRARPQTLRKAEITRDQLQRRYSALNASITSSTPMLKPTNVARWFSNLKPNTRQLIEEAEPLSWLRHLRRLRQGTSRERSPWTLSALVVDEYVRSTIDASFERQPLQRDLSEVVTTVKDIDSLTSGLGHVSSRPSSVISNDLTSLSRRKSDDLISFEPVTTQQSRRSSGGTESRNSVESNIQRWRYSLSGAVHGRGTGGNGSSVRLDASQGSSSPKRASPQMEIASNSTSFSNGERHYDPAGERKRRTSLSTSSEKESRVRNSFSSAGGPPGTKGQNKGRSRLATHSDSSAVDSASDAVGEGGFTGGLSRIGEDTVPDLSKVSDGKDRREPRRSRFRLSLDMRNVQGRASVEDVRNKLLPPLSISDLRTDALVGLDGKPALKSTSLPLGNLSMSPTGGMTTTATTSNPSHISLTRQRSSPSVVRRNKIIQRGPRTSLPGSLHSSRIPSAPIMQSPDLKEHELSVEYSRKKELSESLRARNTRMKALLQTASKTIAEYDEIQRQMSEALGVNCNGVATDVLDALSHDPASATGNTRRATGWRAVEEIHERCVSQSDVLESFISSLPKDTRASTLPVNGIYHDTMTQLSHLLERLRSERAVTLSQVKNLTERLREVKALRDQLKPELDETGKYTSLNYPEIVRLEALLDGLMSNRNPFWRIGESLLSFLLTFVAPFMKTFGRPIWDDLHDFLVIPLYRNNFSGEEEWYPLSFPRRSFSHWMRLLLFSVAIPSALRNGIRLFIALLTEGFLIRVPSYVPPVLVYAILSGIMSSLAGTLFSLLLAFLCEIVITLWWLGWLLHIVR